NQTLSNQPSPTNGNPPPESRSAKVGEDVKERRNKRTGRTEKARIWEVTDRTVRTWIGEAVAAAAADGVTFSVPVTPHTFRHSYAMHMLYAGIPLKVLQSQMGHKSISSTEVYTKVFALDVAARHRVQFLMPESDAVSMLKRIP
ncbi:tyrosine-type recombinase/integrase, partial [Escherichia coli]|uniref:tyrosine-type recombinase/integrase n=2 Tax=Escherichia coli TaxID=562 RepID=UPI003CF55DEA